YSWGSSAMPARLPCSWWSCAGRGWSGWSWFPGRLTPRCTKWAGADGVCDFRHDTVPVTASVTVKGHPEDTRPPSNASRYVEHLQRTIHHAVFDHDDTSPHLQRAVGTCTAMM